MNPEDYGYANLLQERFQEHQSDVDKAQLDLQEKAGGIKERSVKAGEEVSSAVFMKEGISNTLKYGANKLEKMGLKGLSKSVADYQEGGIQKVISGGVERGLRGVQQVTQEPTELQDMSGKPIPEEQQEEEEEEEEPQAEEEVQTQTQEEEAPEFEDNLIDEQTGGEDLAEGVAEDAGEEVAEDAATSAGEALGSAVAGDVTSAIVPTALETAGVALDATGVGAVVGVALGIGGVLASIFAPSDDNEEAIPPPPNVSYSIGG